MPMSRPVLVAITLALCGANCSDGTCQTLQSYFDCEFDGSGGGGGGNTIAAASCAGSIPIVVRTSFQFVNSSNPAIFKQGLIQRAKDEASFFFNRQEALRGLRVAFHKGHFKTDEALFVARALSFGLGNDARHFRRWIPKREAARERMWRELFAVWQSPSVFAVASPAAECEFCLRLPVPVYEWDSENDRYIPNKPDNPFAVHVSIMQKVMPVNLEQLSLRELLVFLLGYVEDLSAFAGLGLWHDCHLGNLLMQKPKGKEDHVFYWHDFGGVSSGIHPQKAVLEEFVRKMRGTIHETAEMIHTRDPQVTIPEPLFEVAGAAALQRDLREFTEFFRIEVMRSADESVRKAVLGALTSILSGEILTQLERELIQRPLAQALSQL